MWDNLTCWQAASVGEVVVVSCPELFHDFVTPEEGELQQTEELTIWNILISWVFFFFFYVYWGLFLPSRNREAQSKLHGVRLVWALSSLRGHLLPLWQRHKTCTAMFISFKCTHHVGFYFTYLFCVFMFRTCTMHLSKPCIRSGTAHPWCLWPLPW